ncbi:MAG TPA: bifunctional diaminohydroxyphosphoribosylaminopyrimidine deaminase/5-amino-6-(5-phosphoribosylamino)uracil reductase RibD [Fimbriimonadaceae bacterium]|nr:bifunctional diaminohydroxyphosphoribosylaminopyrimidine deaminase/5-amino-6-(5-phosphoribosylamino)uracil reductase RibD [Fimbriimonadaceae bacterium]
MTKNAIHDRFMRRAIRLSLRGYPAPNPHVGCVIVRDGSVVGEGFHQYAGGPHAEVVALRQAGTQAQGADVYVTLEPCAHHGRTPPCTEALIEADVSRVVVACRDRYEQAAGGAERLRAAGIEVVVGVLEAEAAATNRRFIVAVARGRPYVTVKAAITLDGMIANPAGESKWITGLAARTAGHRLRAEMGAVLVGPRTALLDDPRLTARVRGVVNPPLRILLDPRGELPADRAAYREAGRTWHVVLEKHADRVGAMPRVDVVPVPGEDGELDLGAVLERLHEDGQTGLLVEGGGSTIRRFLEAGLVDRVDLFVAPKLLGEGVSWIGNRVPGRETSLRLVSTTRLGPDVHLRYDVVPGPSEIDGTSD